MRKERFRIRVGDHEHDVVVELDPATPDVCDVEVDGRRSQVAVSGDATMVVRAQGGAEQTVVTLDPRQPPRQGVVDGRAFPLEVRTRQEAALEDALTTRGRGNSAGASIKAPMPGRVVRVLVSPGDELDVGVPAIIVEAMKMENELRADSAGTVANVNVAEGDTVEAGQVLCEVVAHQAS